MRSFSLLAAVLVLLMIPARVAAQEEIPRDLGKNAGTGDPRLAPPRGGSWELVGIKSTAIFFDGRRESKELPLDTRERRGINWGKEGVLISADVFFTDLKKILKRTNREPEDPTLTVLAKMEIKKQDDGSRSTGNFVSMNCTIDVTSRGERLGGPPIRFGSIKDPVYYPASARTEFTCGGHRLGEYLKLGEDITLNYKLEIYPPHGEKPVDVTYHFSYQWAGWETQPQSSGPSELSALELIDKALQALLKSIEKLASAYADVATISDKWASKATPTSGQKMKILSDRESYRAWAARQKPEAIQANLRQKVSATYKLLDRPQQNAFYKEISTALAATQAAAAQDGSLLRTTKPVFAVNEQISVEYDKPQGSGWDWIVIVQPNDLPNAGGNFSAIKPEYGWQFDPNDNSFKDRRGTKTFRALPVGEYEARYVSWSVDGRAGANQVIASVPFKVGNPPPNGPPTGGNPPPANLAGDLTGLWKNPGGQAVYRVRQIGSTFVWGMDATALGSWANMFEGQIAGNHIDGVLEDLPGSPTIGGGRMLLKIESDCRFTRASSVNQYGADVWVKIGSPCDATGLAQRAPNVDTRPDPGDRKPAPTNDNQSGPIVVVSDPLGIFDKPSGTGSTATQKQQPKAPPSGATKTGTDRTGAPPTRTGTVGQEPKLVDIPENPVAANQKPTGVVDIPEPPATTQKPTGVVDIPEDPPTTNQKPTGVADIPGDPINSPPTTTTRTNEPPSRPQQEPKPKSGSKIDWGAVGAAIGGAIRAGSQPSQPAPTGGGTQPDAGQCRGGSYWLGTPTPQSWRANTPGAGVRIPWSTPIGVRKAYLVVFSGGRAVFPHESLPENTNDCGLSWSFYPGPGYYDVYLYDPSRRAVAGPVRFVVTQ